jgi:hypothetical protein
MPDHSTQDGPIADSLLSWWPGSSRRCRRRSSRSAGLLPAGLVVGRLRGSSRVSNGKSEDVPGGPPHLQVLVPGPGGFQGGRTCLGGAFQHERRGAPDLPVGIVLEPRCGNTCGVARTARTRAPTLGENEDLLLCDGVAARHWVFASPRDHGPPVGRRSAFRDAELTKDLVVSGRPGGQRRGRAVSDRPGGRACRPLRTGTITYTADRTPPAGSPTVSPAPSTIPSRVNDRPAAQGTGSACGVSWRGDSGCGW